MSSLSCPPRNTLVEWLDGRADSKTAIVVEQHVEHCSGCQSVLDGLTACRIGGDRTTAAMTDGLRRLAENSPSIFGPSAESTLSSDTRSTAPAQKLPQLPGYEPLRLIGRGGMGRIYLARHSALDRLVAIKVMSAERSSDPRYVARARAEARSLAALKHPNVVQVYDVIECDGLPAIVMEWISDGSLHEYAAGKEISPAEACGLVEQIARGVHAAHERGIVHRDLKPANILMDGLVPRVTDFGLASTAAAAADERLTTTDEVFGTPEYMAPEQIRDGVQRCTPRSDIYSLGVILYELLTGSVPFRGSTVFQTMELIVNTRPIDPTTLQPRIPEPLNRICIRCLQKDPDRRFDSALSLAEALAESARVFADTGEQSAEANVKLKRRHLLKRLRTGAVSAGVVAGLVGATVLAARLLFIQPGNVANEGGTVGGDLDRSQNAPGVAAGTNRDLLPVNSQWKGTFTFLPAAADHVDGDVELVIDIRQADEFKGTFFSEERRYAWRVSGRLQQEQISWEFTSALKDNAVGDVVGIVRVTGTADGDVIQARWVQAEETARLLLRRVQ